MIELDQHEGSYLSICKHFRAIVETEAVKDDADKKMEVRKGLIPMKVFTVWQEFLLFLYLKPICQGFFALVKQTVCHHRCFAKFNRTLKTGQSDSQINKL